MYFTTGPLGHFGSESWDVSMIPPFFLLHGMLVDVTLCGLVKSDLVVLHAYVAPSSLGFMEVISVVKRCYDAMPVTGPFSVDEVLDGYGPLILHTFVHRFQPHHVT